MVGPAGDQVFDTWGCGRHFIFKPQDAQWKSLSEELNEQISSQLCYLSQSKACLYLDETSLKSDGRNFQVFWGQAGRDDLGHRAEHGFPALSTMCFRQRKSVRTFYNPSLRPPTTKSQGDLSQVISSHLKDLRVVGWAEYRAICRRCMINDTLSVRGTIRIAES